MKKATNKLMSFLAAFAMVLSVLVAPFANANADAETQEKETEKLTIHKILMSQDALDKHNVEKEGYDGNKIKDIKDYFESGAEEIAGVYFKLQKPADGKTNPDVNTDADWVDMGQDYEGLTTANGLELNTKGLSGSYRIVEVHEKSTYVGKDGATLTDKKAVPSIVVLPLYNDDGVVTDAHMYPKNTENAPQIDKNFIKENGLEAVEDNQKNKDAGAAYENYKKEKATAKAEVGKNVPYEVKTEIPAKSNLAEAKWDDKMTEGLTYNKDLTVTIDYVEVEGEGEDAKEVQKSSTLTTEELTKSGELTQSDKGFVLKLQGDNLALLNGKVKPVTVTLKYSATVNSSAIADIPEANDIKFFYGNTPSNGTTPLPTKPNDNGEVTVEKTWDNGSNFEDGEWAKFKLVDANTGEDVKASDLVNAPKDYTFESVVELKKDGNTSYTWKYLNKDKQYKVVEVESKTLSDAEYTEAADGTIKVTNHKSNNPKPLNPTEPKVVLGGKKFVKTNNKEGDDQERLAGAEFYVKNEKGEYLVAAKKDAEAVKNAKKDLDDAVTAYNDRVQGEEETDEAFETREKELKDAIDSAQDAYNKAFKENATAYTWGKKDDANVVVLTSDGQGRFEISGLEYGSYKLEEKTAPKGYAKLSGDVEFKVEKGSYSAGNIDYKPESNAKDALQVINKKVTIPETGGIGSLIFIVAGLALMGVAFVAMKRRNSYEEA